MIKTTKPKKYESYIIKDFSSSCWDENGVDTGASAVFSYNTSCDGKTLGAGLGISEATFPTSSSQGSTEIVLNYQNLNLSRINNLLYFRQYFPTSGNTQHRLLLHGSDGKLYVHQMYYGVGTLLWLYELTFQNPPICLTYKLNGKDTIILSSPEKMVVWTTDVNPYEVTNVPIITSMCISNNVLFCTIAGEADTIWYNTSLNPEQIGTNTTYSRSLTLGDERGYARKVLTFKENLYVFRDYGITRINYYYTNSVDVKHVYLSDSKIYSNTVAVCGDVVVFLTKDGVYTFDGVNVKKKSIGFEKFLSAKNNDAVASCLQDKYYLALNLDYDDGKKILVENGTHINNSLIIIDLSDFSFQLIRGVDVKSMLALKTVNTEKMILTFNNGEVAKLGEVSKTAKYFNQALAKFYQTREIFSGNYEEFVVRKLIVDSSANVTIELITDEGSKTFVTKKAGVNIFQTILKGKKLSCKISATSENFDVKYLEINYFKK